MARVTSFDVTLDANVLIPIVLCDTLLRLAEAGFYRPHWSVETLDEVARNLTSKLGVHEDLAQKRVAEMAGAFPEALVERVELLVPSMPNDSKDRHVLAAAILSGSQVIVTSNTKHFKSEHLAPFNIEAQTPDLFLVHQSTLDTQATAEILRKQAAEKVRPPVGVDELLGRLCKSAPQFAHAMRLLLLNESVP
jgi:predicted nucleic acid-binding protein